MQSPKYKNLTVEQQCAAIMDAGASHASYLRELWDGLGRTQVAFARGVTAYRESQDLLQRLDSLLARRISPTNLSSEAKRRTTVSVYYALHIRRKDGREQTEFNRRGVLPEREETMCAILSGEQINVRVLNVITAPRANERAALVHNVYAVET
jgi:hypothetical protein